MLSLLNKISVNKGDCIFVNGGEPHAIGAGCFMIETQEPTDLMGIVERHTVTGRELSDQKMHCGIGFDNMLKMFNYNGYTKEEIINKYKIKSTQIDNNIYSLVDERYTEKFVILKLMNDSIFKKHITNGVLIVVNGNGKINNIDVKKGDRLFIDSIDEIYTSGNNLEVVVCY